jgi:hypothetical protein
MFLKNKTVKSTVVQNLMVCCLPVKVLAGFSIAIDGVFGFSVV